MELSGPIGRQQVMVSARSDASVIAASLAEPDRFAEIFDRHFATVFRFAERRVGRDQAAEVASETLARAFAKRDAFRPEAVDALPWLLGIASKLILHERRRFVRYLAAVERASAEIRTVDPDGGLGSVDRRLDAPAEWARMRAALLTLADTDRELLLLVTWDELSYEEAAAVLELPRRHGSLQAASREGASAGTSRAERENSRRPAHPDPEGGHITMNDELDALRSFRPEATGPTDALQRQERIALMETIAHAPSGAPRRLPRLRPRRRILLGIAIALVAAVGTAGASGMIPADVQQALGLAAADHTDAALTPQIDQAVERASAPTADGGTVQLWTAPTNGGGTCAYVRQLDAAGAPTDSGPISCAVSIAGGGRMGSEMMDRQDRIAAAAR